MCNVRLDDKISAEELRTRLKLKSMSKCVQDRRLEWFGHLERMEESAWSSKCRTFQVSQGIIQKKSGSRSRTLPLVIFDKKVPFFLKIVLFFILRYFWVKLRQKCPFLKIPDAALKF